MYIQGKTLREFVCLLAPGAMLDVIAPVTRKLKEKADISRMLDLCARDEVGGVATGARLKYLVAKVPDLTPREGHSERPGTGCIGQDSRTVHSGDNTLALNYTHDARACSTYSPAARAVTAGPRGMSAKFPFEDVKAACEAVSPC